MQLRRVLLMPIDNLRRHRGTRGVITCGHHGLNDLIPMVEALNAVAGEVSVASDPKSRV